MHHFHITKKLATGNIISSFLRHPSKFRLPATKQSLQPETWKTSQYSSTVPTKSRCSFSLPGQKFWTHLTSPLLAIKSALQFWNSIRIPELCHKLNSILLLSRNKYPKLSTLLNSATSRPSNSQSVFHAAELQRKQQTCVPPEVTSATGRKAV